jgi:hypothetical protein
MITTLALFYIQKILKETLASQKWGKKNKNGYNCQISIPM